MIGGGHGHAETSKRVNGEGTWSEAEDVRQEEESRDRRAVLAFDQSERLCSRSGSGERA